MENIVFLSGGKDSTATLFLMLENNIKIDDIVFIDTGIEFKEMYQHLNLIEETLNRKITRLHPSNSFEDLFFGLKKIKTNIPTMASPDLKTGGVLNILN